MSSQKMKIAIFIFFIIVISFFIPNNAFAGYQELNNLDFEIHITEDGNMQVTEIWDVFISETNTLYKTFPKDDTYSEIKDVSVSEITSNEKSVNFSKVDKYMYHVTENCFQALENPDGDFEIAWGVNVLGSEDRVFKISYTVLDNVKKYNDCAELYWKLIGDDFQIYSKNVTGAIYLPDGIENIENLKVWAHGPLNGTITRESKNKVSFNVNDVEGGTFLEIRIVTPQNIIVNSNRIINKDMLSLILEEEKVFAEEANMLREQKANQEIILKKVGIIVQVILIIFMLTRINKNSRKLNNTPKQKPEQEFEYFRDIPDEESTPGEAGFIYYFNKNGVSYYISKIVSATMLNLALKKYIEFQEISKKEININIKDGYEKLEDDEKLIFDFIKKASKDSNTITMKEFEKFCKKNISKFGKILESMPKIWEKKCESKNLYNKELKRKYDNSIGAFALYLILGCFDTILILINIPLFLTLITLIIINCIIILMYAGRVKGLTQEGINYEEKWNGLKKYMENFSLLNERSVPELVLWEKYLVYATAFGIADKVIKQLKITYPELENEEFMKNNFAYMHIACNSNNDFNFMKSIDSSIGSVTNYSSSTGSGGGFSSGGGGGGRRRWWRRSLKIKKIK